MTKGHVFAFVGMCRLVLGVCAGLAFAVGATGLAWADPHPMALGALAGPKVPVEIRLRSETLHIRVLNDRAEVAADLDLENAGPARTLDIGFPCERGEHAGTLALDCRTPLAVTANGRRVANQLQKTATGPEYTWPMSFAAAEKKQLRVQYTTRLRNDRYPTPVAGALLLLYRLRTGADWAGSIDRLDIDISLPSDAVAWIAPTGYTRTTKHIAWRLSNYEPTQDVIVFFAAQTHGAAISVAGQLAKEKGPGRAKLIEHWQDLAKRLGQPSTAEEQQAVGKSLFPLFKLPPPTGGIAETLAESSRLMQAEYPAPDGPKP